MISLRRFSAGFRGLVLGAAVPAFASAATVTIAADRPGSEISPTMWGAFFEDINFGADGGLYAELIKNRGFEFPDPLLGWTKLSPSLAQGELTVRTDAPFDADNPHYVRLRSEGTAPFGLSNEGFRGIGVRPDEDYDLALRVRRIDGHARLSIRLYGGDGSVLATADLGDLAAEWTRRTAVLQPHDPDAHARLAVLVLGKGTVDVDFISLFPRHTWKNRPGGLRADLVQALADLHPGFLRFPGGCVVEGSVLSRRYQWKRTLGPVEQRHVLINRWNYEFLHRPTPDYFQSFGLGFFEYFQLCEDVGARPLPILNCGMACQFNSGELCAPDDIVTYIQDALDLVEFANGPATSTWGARRAALGHPEPFHLTMIGIGNEQWGADYFERFRRFAEVFRAKHPEIALVAAAGPDPGDARFQRAWATLPGLGAAIIDEHCYAAPSWFIDHATRYDSRPRGSAKVFMGEYAAQSVAIASPKNRNTLETALAEAAYMTGLERNADLVRMSSYAPLFAHVDAWQWTPDLIWFDNLRVIRTANYQVQALFARNRGSRVLPTSIQGARTLFASAVADDASGAVILKLVNVGDQPDTAHVAVAGWTGPAVVRQTALQGQPGEFATFDSAITPQESSGSATPAAMTVPLPAHAFLVLRLTHPPKG